MPDNLLVFRDYYKIKLPTDEQKAKLKDFKMSDSVLGNKRGLDITMEATHSALFNSNLRMYLPSRMEDGASTFVNRRKPAKILKNHNPEQDPVGIIVGARYVHKIPDYLKDNKDVQIMCDSSNSIKKQVAAAKRFMQSGIPFSDGWEGLGYVELQARILDTKMQEQILDGRYDSVSTSFRSPGEAYCSQCQQNLAKDGMCAHVPGESYNDDDDGPKAPMAIIPGVHLNEECSIVVNGADPLTLISIGMSDSENKIYSIPVEDWNNNHEAQTYNNSVFEFKDIKKEDLPMTIPAAVETKLSDAEQVVFDFIKKLRPELENKNAEDFAKTIVKAKDADGKLPLQEELKLEDETAMTYALEDLETKDQEINGDAVCDEMQTELKTMLDTKVIDEETWKQADSSISKDARIKLSDSTFCGPNRSFPVLEDAHVTAALQLIARYEGPGNKAEILSDVFRKAKVIGAAAELEVAPPKVEDTVVFEVPSSDVLAKASNEDILSLFARAEVEAITRNLKLARECSKCADSIKKADDFAAEAKAFEDKLKENELTLRVLREELRRQYADYAAQVDSYVTLGTKLHTAKLEKLALVSVLSNKSDTLESAIDSLKDTDLSKQEDILMDSFKLVDIMTKLNDGMARDPQGTVDNPVVNTDNNNNQLPDGLSKTAIAAISSIKSILTDAEKITDDNVKNSKIMYAKQFYARMVEANVLDKENVPFETLSVVKETTE